MGGHGSSTHSRNGQKNKTDHLQANNTLESRNEYFTKTTNQESLKKILLNNQVRNVLPPPMRKSDMMKVT
jgi:hypothetical protein